jgi:hypothetical protein
MDPTASVLFSHFTSAALVVWIIQFLKNATWFPWLQKQGQFVVKRVLSIGGALGAHLGISFAWHSLGAGPSGTHQFIVTLPAWSVILAFLWRWAGQFVMQDGWYKIVYERLSVAGVASPLPAPIAKT